MSEVGAAGGAFVAAEEQGQLCGTEMEERSEYDSQVAIKGSACWREALSTSSWPMVQQVVVGKSAPQMLARVARKVASSF